MNHRDSDDLKHLKNLWKSIPAAEKSAASPDVAMAAAELERALGRQHRTFRLTAIGIVAGMAPVVWMCMRLWRHAGERPLVLSGVGIMLLAILGMIGLVLASVRRPDVSPLLSTVDYVERQIGVLQRRRKLSRVHVRIVVALILVGLELLFIDRFWPAHPGRHLAALAGTLAWVWVVFRLVRRRAERGDARMAGLIAELERLRSVD